MEGARQQAGEAALQRAGAGSRYSRAGPRQVGALGVEILNPGVTDGWMVDGSRGP